MDRNWNRGGANSGSSGSSGNIYGGGEKNYKQPYSGGQHHNNTHYSHYRKKNDFSGPEFYCKAAKPAIQPLKKESLQVSLIEDELMDVNFSWIKNGGTQVQLK
jgi:hypothetical protein